MVACAGASCSCLSCRNGLASVDFLVVSFVRHLHGVEVADVRRLFCCITLKLANSGLPVVLAGNGREVVL